MQTYASEPVQEQILPGRIAMYQIYSLSSGYLLSEELDARLTLRVLLR